MSCLYMFLKRYLTANVGKIYNHIYVYIINLGAFSSTLFLTNKLRQNRINQKPIIFFCQQPRTLDSIHMTKKKKNESPLDKHIFCRKLFR